MAVRTEAEPRAAQILRAVTADHRTLEPDRDDYAAKTYNYLRLGMVVAVAALAYSIVEEYRQPGVHTLLGSISGYYYTPVRPVFIGVMVAIGFALIVIKGRTPIEDACLTLAGIMAPIVAFVPTSDDTNGVGRAEMLSIGHYQPDPGGSRFVDESISNNLHAYVFAGYIAIALVFIAFLLQRRKVSKVAWIYLAVGLGLAVTGSILLRWANNWVLELHARAAIAMFVFLAAAAITNSVLGFIRGDTNKVYAWSYGVVGVLMVVFGGLFVLCQAFDWSTLGGRLVLYIEAVEILLFVTFWGTQTVERWNRTV
jgi:hypothetical protein